MYSAQIAYRPDLQAALLALEGMVLLNQFGDELRIAVRPVLARDTLEATINRVLGEPCRLQEAEPNLEDVFIAITRGETDTP